MNLRTRFALSIGFLGLGLVLPASARADLVGTTVTGSLDFDADGLNFYNPALGFVPAGYQNSPGAQNSNTVVIVGGNEFGFTDPGNNTDVTSFSSTGFTFTDTAITAGLNLNIILTLTDPAFTGVSLISSTFPGLTFAISGDQITVDIPGLNVSAGEVLTASFNVTSTSSVPEPSTYGLMLIGFGFLGFMMAMRKRLGLGIPQAS